MTAAGLSRAGPDQPPSEGLGAGVRRVAASLAELGADEQARLMLLGAAIGAAAGGVTMLFYGAIDLVQNLTLRGALRSGLPAVAVIPLLVGLGLVASRSLVRWGARGSAGENIPDVMYRVTVKGGVIHAVPVLAKTLAAAVVIGTGGSVGVEGPVVVAGAAVGSRIGRWLRASPNRLRTLVGCGAAAGISAAFNAPITGVVFGIEKILGTTGSMALGPFVVASILAATVGRAAFGDHPVLAMPATYGVSSAWELLLFGGLGVTTGIVSVLYSRGVWWAGDGFGRIRSRWLKVAVGALIVGGLDLVLRADLWGHGHQSLNLGIVAARTAWFLLALTAAKLLATASTFGAGGVGGVFTPALFIGATLGGACGLGAAAALPGWDLQPGAFALVGMAGLVAGATHAPLTAIMMVFEMTGDYGLILPLMLTGVLAYAVARRLHPENIYSEWLARRGVVLSHGADAVVLARITVADCVSRAPTVIAEAADLAAILDVTRAGLQTAYPVVDDEGGLAGMISLEAIRAAREGGEYPARLVVAADLAVPEPGTLAIEDSLLTALRRFGQRDVEVLPVVASGERARFEGLVRREDVVAAYERALVAEGL